MTSQSTSPSFNLPTGKTMVDVVTFIATLVSKSSEIDPQLDRVRAITSQRSSTELTKEDNHVLREVYNYLEDYLIKKESLRSFTRDSIRKKVSDYLRGSKPRANLRMPLGVMWGIAIGGALVAVAMPDVIMPAAVKPTLAISTFFVAIDLGAAWMFWTGRKNFKDKIRQAYLPISLGIALVGLTLLQAPLVVAIDQDNSVWFHYITSGLTIPIADMLLYVGIRRFAQIGGITNKLLSSKLVFALCIGFVIFINLIPWPATGAPSWALAISLSTLTVGTVISIVAARITAVVRQSLSSAYKQPMGWFMAYLLVSGFSCVLYGTLQVAATPEHPYDPRGVALLPLVASGFVTLKAGTSFRRIDTD